MRVSAVSLGAAVLLLAAAALVSVIHVTHHSELEQSPVHLFAVPVVYYYEAPERGTPLQQLRVVEASNRLAGYEVPGTTHSTRSV